MAKIYDDKVLYIVIDALVSANNYIIIANQNLNAGYKELNSQVKNSTKKIVIEDLKSEIEEGKAFIESMKGLFSNVDNTDVENDNSFSIDATLNLGTIPGIANQEATNESYDFSQELELMDEHQKEQFKKVFEELGLTEEEMTEVLKYIETGDAYMISLFYYKYKNRKDIKDKELERDSKKEEIDKLESERNTLYDDKTNVFAFYDAYITTGMSYTDNIENTFNIGGKEVTFHSYNEAIEYFEKNSPEDRTKEIADRIEVLSAEVTTLNSDIKQCRVDLQQENNEIEFMELYGEYFNNPNLVATKFLKEILKYASDNGVDLKTCSVSAIFQIAGMYSQQNPDKGFNWLLIIDYLRENNGNFKNKNDQEIIDMFKSEYLMWGSLPLFEGTNTLYDLDQLLTIDYKYMSDEDKRVFNYLYEVKGRDEAFKLMDSLENRSYNAMLGTELGYEKFESIVSKPGKIAECITAYITGGIEGVRSWYENTYSLVTGDYSLTVNDYEMQTIQYLLQTCVASYSSVTKEDLIALEEKEQITAEQHQEILDLMNSTNTPVRYYDILALKGEITTEQANEIAGYMSQIDGGEKYARYVLTNFYSGGVSSGNMLPSMLISTIPGMRWAGQLAMFASCAGGTYREQMRSGAYFEQALLAGIVNGGMELATEKMLGGLAGLSDNVPDLEKWATLSLKEKAVALMITSPLSEMKEETFQLFVGDFIQCLITGEPYTLTDQIAQLPDTLISTYISTVGSNSATYGRDLVLNVGGKVVSFAQSEIAKLVNPDGSIDGQTFLNMIEERRQLSSSEVQSTESIEGVTESEPQTKVEDLEVESKENTDVPKEEQESIVEETKDTALSQEKQDSKAKVQTLETNKDESKVEVQETKDQESSTKPNDAIIQEEKDRKLEENIENISAPKVEQTETEVQNLETQVNEDNLATPNISENIEVQTALEVPLNSENINQIMNNPNNMYYGHGTSGSDGSIAASIMENGLRCSHGQMYFTTNPLETGTHMNENTLQSLNNWNHNDSKNIVVVSLPMQYMFLSGNIAQREEAFYYNPNNVSNQNLTTTNYVMPEFILGYYDSTTGVFHRNPNYYELLTSDSKQKVLDRVKENLVSAIEEYSDIDTYRETCRDLGYEFPLTEDEVVKYSHNLNNNNDTQIQPETLEVDTTSESESTPKEEPNWDNYFEDEDWGVDALETNTDDAKVDVQAVESQESVTKPNEAVIQEEQDRKLEESVENISAPKVEQTETEVQNLETKTDENKVEVQETKEQPSPTITPEVKMEVKNFIEENNLEATDEDIKILEQMINANNDSERIDLMVSLSNKELKRASVFTFKEAWQLNRLINWQNQELAEKIVSYIKDKQIKDIILSNFAPPQIAIKYIEEIDSEMDRSRIIKKLETSKEKYEALKYISDESLITGILLNIDDDVYKEKGLEKLSDEDNKFDVINSMTDIDMKLKYMHTLDEKNQYQIIKYLPSEYRLNELQKLSANYQLQGLDFNFLTFDEKIKLLENLDKIKDKESGIKKLTIEQRKNVVENTQDSSLITLALTYIDDVNFKETYMKNLSLEEQVIVLETINDDSRRESIANNLGITNDIIKSVILNMQKNNSLRYNRNFSSNLKNFILSHFSFMRTIFKSYEGYTLGRYGGDQNATRKLINYKLNDISFLYDHLKEFQEFAEKYPGFKNTSFETNTKYNANDIIKIYNQMQQDGVLGDYTIEDIFYTLYQKNQLLFNESFKADTNNDELTNQTLKLWDSSIEAKFLGMPLDINAKEIKASVLRKYVDTDVGYLTNNVNAGPRNFALIRDFIYSMTTPQEFKNILDMVIDPEPIVTDEYRNLQSKLKAMGVQSAVDQRKILNSIESKAGVCSYAAIVNLIFAKYHNNPNEFKRIFGYDMTIEVDGIKHLNSSELLLDIYLFANSNLYRTDGNEFFTFNQDGTLSISKNYEDSNDIDNTEQIYLAKGSGVELDPINEFFKYKGSNIVLDSDTILYLPSYGFQNPEVIKEFVYEHLSQGDLITLGMDKVSDTINFKYISTTDPNETRILGGGHAIFLTGIDNDYVYIASWGHEFKVSLNDFINNSFDINAISINENSNLESPNISDSVNTDNMPEGSRGTIESLDSSENIDNNRENRINDLLEEAKTNGKDLSWDYENEKKLQDLNIKYNPKDIQIFEKIQKATSDIEKVSLLMNLSNPDLIEYSKTYLQNGSDSNIAKILTQETFNNELKEKGLQLLVGDGYKTQVILSMSDDEMKIRCMKLLNSEYKDNFIIRIFESLSKENKIKCVKQFDTAYKFKLLKNPLSNFLEGESVNNYENSEDTMTLQDYIWLDLVANGEIYARYGISKLSSDKLKFENFGLLKTDTDKAAVLASLSTDQAKIDNLHLIKNDIDIVIRSFTDVENIKKYLMTMKDSSKYNMLHRIKNSQERVGLIASMNSYYQKMALAASEDDIIVNFINIVSGNSKVFAASLISDFNIQQEVMKKMSQEEQMATIYYISDINNRNRLIKALNLTEKQVMDSLNLLMKKGLVKYDAFLPENFEFNVFRRISDDIDEFFKRNKTINKNGFFGADQNATRKYISYTILNYQLIENIEELKKYMINKFGYTKGMSNLHLNMYEYSKLEKFILDLYANDEALAHDLLLKTFKRNEANEYTRLLNKLQNENGLSIQDARRVLDSLDTTGICTYAAFANVIFAAYRNNEEAFYNDFGYSMYIKDGISQRLNSSELLLDMYIYFNSNKVKSDYFFNIDENGNIQVKDEFDTESQTFLLEPIDYNASMMNDFLADKNPNLKLNSYFINPNETSIDLKREIIKALENNELLTLGIDKTPDKEFKFIPISNILGNRVITTKTWNEGDAHAIFITNIDSKYVYVASWGSEYKIALSDFIDNEYRMQVYDIAGISKNEDNSLATNSNRGGNYFNRVQEFLSGKFKEEPIEQLETDDSDIEILDIEDEPITKSEINALKKVFGQVDDGIIKDLKLSISKLKEIGKSNNMSLKEMAKYQDTVTEPNMEAKKLAQELSSNAKISEPSITASLKEIEDSSLSGITFDDLQDKVNSKEVTDFKVLIGLEHRLKGEERLATKIYDDSITKGESLETAASEIGDSIRYTLLIDDADYVKIVDETLHKLEKEGFLVDEFKNRWGKPKYQGINTSILSPDGVRFELQFHTLESFYTKENLTHNYYEIARNENLKAKLNYNVKDLADSVQIQYQKLVSKPDGVLDYDYKGGRNAN